jgi:hypothetical protein
MSDEKPNHGSADADESAPSQPTTPGLEHPLEHDAAAARAGHGASYTPAQEAQVVRKLDWNLMTLFFVLCECSA